ncbi:MAG: ParB-like protein [Stellaceae bacterium]
MAIVREPVLTTVAIADLRPTQITVGMREVEAKRKHWRETAKKTKKKAGEFLGRHLIPVVLGPKDRHYIVDHHHLARALHDEGVKEVAVTVISNLGALDRDAFWAVMDNRSWMHPYDDQGRRQHHTRIPKSVIEMVDDPFRSLAGELRRQGGFAKDTTPFSEFLWADFLRRQLKRKLVENDFDGALERAMQLAKAEAAGYLPGWCGPVPGN